jgi:Ni/Co efflux regulator RcnB
MGLKHLLLAVLASAVMMAPLADAAAKSSSAKPKTVTVRGYTKKNGTYVAPHKRATPSSKQEEPPDVVTSML